MSDEQRVESVLRRPMLIPKALLPVVKSMPARHTTFDAQQLISSASHQGGNHGLLPLALVEY